MNDGTGTHPPLQSSFPDRWFIRLLAAGIVCEICFFYEDTLLWMKTAWVEYPPDRAGMLVVPLFLWMTFLRLKKLPEGINTSPLPGYFIICSSLSAAFLGRIIDINFLQAVSMIGLGFGIMVSIGGTMLGCALLFPFCFLMLMIPSVSYLIESFAGTFLRQAVLHGSGFVLKATGGGWGISPAGLIYNDQSLPIQFLRSGLSSVLFLLIVIFVAAEGSFKKELRKFLFTALFALFFVAAQSMYFIFSGWAMAFNMERLRTFFILNERWIPALLFLCLLAAGRYFAASGERKQMLPKKG
jgi:hypothetical protein